MHGDRYRYNRYKKSKQTKVHQLPGCPHGITRDHDSLFVCVEEYGIYKINISDYTAFHVICCNLPAFSYVSVYITRTTKIIV